MPSLITDEIAALAGQRRSYRAPEELGRAAIRYFALAVGDANPLYTDTAFARAHGQDDVVAPPTLLCETNQYAALPPDADGYAGHSWDLQVPGTRLVRGGNDYRFHRYARPGDVVTATWEVTDLTERVNRAGAPMLIVTSSARYAGDDGDPIAENTETLIYVGEPATPAGRGDRSGRASAPTRTGEAGQAEEPEHDRIEPLVRRITAVDMVAYAGATWDWHRMHFDGTWCAEHGLPGPVVDGQVFGALLAEQVQDHFGPDAFLTSLDFRFSALVFAGETVRCESHLLPGETSDPIAKVSSRVIAVGADGAERTAVAAAGATVRLPGALDG